MKDGRRKTFIIIGIVLIASALGAMGYAAWNLISTEINTQNSMDEIDQMLSDMEAYTGSPDDGLLPTADVTQPDTQPPDVQQAGELPDITDEPIFNTDVPADDIPEPGLTAPADTNPTSKPRGGSSPAKPIYLGKLVFESLGGRKVPVINGENESNLGRGAVHHSRSSPAGGVGNCVIYGHRNTVFRGFGNLKNGDTIRLEVPGNIFSYKIASMSVVEPDDPIIFKAYGRKVMTLVTCYPFNYAGSAPQRYIVVCVLE